MTDEKIPGGFILLSRKLLSSGIMQKPPLYMKLWIWMLLQASHSDHGSLKRGQFFTNIERMQNAMTYKVGYRTERPTVKEIRGVYDFLTKGNAIVTMKVTHGMVITILNYDQYQDWRNYEGHSEGHNEGTSKGTILTKKGNKEGKQNPEKIFAKISTLKSRYSDPRLIDKAIEAIASTRKTNRIADTVILAQLEKWGRYPADQVETAIRIYLDRDFAAQGKGENYLFGIIRGEHKSANLQQKPIINPDYSQKEFDFEHQFKGA